MGEGKYKKAGSQLKTPTRSSMTKTKRYLRGHPSMMSLYFKGAGAEIYYLNIGVWEGEEKRPESSLRYSRTRSSMTKMKS